MGMFDRIWFTCPNCRELIEEQSKAGDCLLRDYDQKAVPLPIAGAIVDSELYCNSCKETFVIKAANIPPPTTIEMTLVKKQ
jgi:uncharacterized protein YbaR (Trm112 family)